MSKRSDLLQLIEEKLAEAKSAEDDAATPKPKPRTRTEVNRVNAQDSTGPRTPEGKARASANSLKHGFFSNIASLHPKDCRTYIEIHENLRMGLQPDGPAEEHLIEELAMLSARLKRLEAAEYALVLGSVDGESAIPAPPPTDGFFDYDHLGDSIRCPDGKITGAPDSRSLAQAFQQTRADLEALNKIETTLRRAYNRAWDRLERMQKDRRKLSIEDSRKRSQIWLNYYKQKADIENTAPRPDTRSPVNDDRVAQSDFVKPETPPNDPQPDQDVHNPAQEEPQNDDS